MSVERNSNLCITTYLVPVDSFRYVLGREGRRSGIHSSVKMNFHFKYLS